jgi:ribosomal subunit interface protein
MQIQVSGKGVDVGDSLRAHIEKRLQEGVSKYSDRVNAVQVVVSRDAHMFRVDINANTGTHSGIIIKGRDSAGDVYAAFDASAEKVEKQLRRYKRRLTNHHHTSTKEGAAQLVQATKYVLQSHAEEEANAEDNAPLIVAEKATDIETLSVSNAVMRMDLLDLPALMFFNAANGRLNVVYRRVDGNISWVDPQTQVAAASQAA